MALLRFTLLAAGLVLTAAQECDVCHLHYYHKEVSSKEVFGADVKQCREYQSESCCTPKIAKGVSVEGYLYSNGDQTYACPAVSAKCQAFFIEEACFYHCDKNLGKWRKHEDCSDAKPNDNAWQIAKMPIKASYCDAWYDACKDDTICADESKSYFDIKNCNARNAKNKNTNGCKKFSDVYTDAEHMCVAMWDNSFTYEKDETKGYTMTFAEGTANPNNLVFTDRDYPATCVNHTVNVTHPHVDEITGERVTAEDAGCAANWHLMPDSGHPLNGTAAKPAFSTSGATSGFSTIAVFAAVLTSAAVMLLA